MSELVMQTQYNIMSHTGIMLCLRLQAWQILRIKICLKELCLSMFRHPESIIRLVISVLALKWLVRYIYYWNSILFWQYVIFSFFILLLKRRFSSLRHRWPLPSLVIPFVGPFGLLFLFHYYIISILITSTLLEWHLY